MANPRPPSPPPPLSSLITKGSPTAVFKIGAKIGQGSCGTVYRAIHLPTRSEVAIKIVELSAMSNYTSVLAREIDLMSRCSSDHFVSFLGAWSTGRQVWIVTELMDGGSLSDFMAITGHTLFECEIGAVLKQCAMALVQFHAERRIHRDVKAGNILLNSSGHAKLADVGVAAQLSSGQPSRRTAVGSPYWMAPEVATTDTDYNEKADIYSLAITAIELAHGEPPNSTLAPLRALQLLHSSRAPNLDQAKGPWSPALIDLIARCTARNPDVRPSAQELLKHPFLADLETEECAEILSAMWRAWGSKVIEYRSMEARIQPLNQSINQSLRAEESQSSLFFRDSGSDSPRSVSFSASRSFLPSASLYDNGSGPPSLSPTPINLTINQSSNNQLSVASRPRSASFSESISFYDADTKTDEDETCTVIDYSQSVNQPGNQSTNQSPSQPTTQATNQSPQPVKKYLNPRDRQRSVATFLASTPTPASILARLDELRKEKQPNTRANNQSNNQLSTQSAHHRRLDSMPILRYTVDRSNNQSISRSNNQTSTHSSNPSIIYVGPGRGSVSYPAYFDQSVNQSNNQSNNQSGQDSGDDLSEADHRYNEASSVVNSYDDELIEQSVNQPHYEFDNYQFNQSLNQPFNQVVDRFTSFDEDDESVHQVYTYSAAD